MQTCKQPGLTGRPLPAQDHSYTNEAPAERACSMLNDATAADKIRCDACPVMCYVKPGAGRPCDRYGNHNGELIRVAPHSVLERTKSHGWRLAPFQAGCEWDPKLWHALNIFSTAI